MAEVSTRCRFACLPATAAVAVVTVAPTAATVGETEVTASAPCKQMHTNTNTAKISHEWNPLLLDRNADDEEENDLDEVDDAASGVDLGGNEVVKSLSMGDRKVSSVSF